MTDKPIKLASGLTLRHGQLIVGNIARDGAKKRTPTPAPTYGHRNRTVELARDPRNVDPVAKPAEKRFLNGKAPPAHPRMASETQSARGTHKGPDHGSEILREAARLGRPLKD